MQNMTLSLYRKNCVYNFEVTTGKIVGAKHPDNRPAGMFVSAVPTDDNGNYLPTQKISFFLGVNDLLQLGNLFKATGECEVKLIHKPDGDFKNPKTKTLTFVFKSPTVISVSLNQSHAGDESQVIRIPGTSFDRGTLWSLEILASEALKAACAYEHKSVRG